jgi:hypothetical protein
MKEYFRYSISIKWIEHNPKPENHDKKHWVYKGLQVGRMRNRITLEIMKKEKQSDSELRKEGLEWCNNYKKKKGKDKNASHFNIKFAFKGMDTWCPGWFSHWTFDEGQSDEEILDSFGMFTALKQDQNYRNGHGHNERDYDNKNPFHCLMGAEDHWRWKGSKTGNVSFFGGTDQETDPPCRCEHCKKQGIIRIMH